MDYEKKYKEALERARAKYAMKDQPIHQDLVDIFPELAESEDEGIYRKLIAFLKQCKAVYGDGFKQFGLNIDDALAWLEKQGEKEEFIKKELECIRGYRDEAIRRLNELEQQGEQKHQYNSRPKYIGEEELLGEQNHTDKVETKFHEGDMIIHKELGGDYIHNPHKIIQVDILDKKYRLEGGLVVHFSEQDDYELVEQEPAWSEEDESMLNFVKVVLNKHKDDAFFDKFKTTLNDCLTWFRNIKSRVGCEVNCTTTKEWSEEDKKMLDGIIEASTHHCYLNITDINWLKFLKDRYTWKPSKEQLHILESVIADYDNQRLSYTKDMLCDLYEQLKNL